MTTGTTAMADDRAADDVVTAAGERVDTVVVGDRSSRERTVDRAAAAGLSSRPLERSAEGSTDAGSSTRSEPPAPGFLRRYRLPLALGAVALCLYVGSILYILLWRGQLA